MTTKNKLTAAEFDAISTILACGGKVVAHMGRKRQGCVNKALILNMTERGWLRLHGRGADGYMRSGPCELNVEVRAAGCVAFNDETARRAAL